MVTSSYGILETVQVDTDVDRIAEEMQALGFSTLDSGMDASAVKAFQDIFDATHAEYISLHGAKLLEDADESNTVRMPMLLDRAFLTLATNPRLQSLLRRLIPGASILNQQNALINPAEKDYNQAAWHRDLPYQHFTSSTPLAINALFCVDDFTLENGATCVLPASHKQGPFPSESFSDKHACPLEVPAGTFIILDCMTFHRGGQNRSQRNRRAVNHVFTIPFFKQQIDIPSHMAAKTLNGAEKKLLGFPYETAKSVSDFIRTRIKKRNDAR